MHAAKLLHTRLRVACPSIHAKRLNTLICATRTLSEDRHLSISGMGRALKSRTSAKHNIKRIDRLVGNVWLQHERIEVYSAVARWLLGKNRTPIILVDWSELTADRQQQLLRASIPVGGRSLTLYEEVHPMSQYANPKVHRHFLSRLKTLLPADVRPIVVTDAGFRGTWFKAVNALDWHWVGRVRNRDYVEFSDQKGWIPAKSLYQRATGHAKRLGHALLACSQKNPVVLHLIKHPKKGRVEKSKLGRPAHNARSNKIARREREPWLIATSPSLAHLTAKQVVSIYRKRMQIEEGFRDIKCERYGLGLSTSLTGSAKRLEILLLLGALALLILWMSGIAAIVEKHHYRYQSNTTRNRNVLSSVFIGMQVMRHHPGVFSKTQLLSAITDVQQAFNYAVES